MRKTHKTRQGETQKIRQRDTEGHRNTDRHTVSHTENEKKDTLTEWTEQEREKGKER